METMDLNFFCVAGAHPLVVEIIELIELRMLSDDLVIDEDLFPDPQDYLDPRWTDLCSALLLLRSRGGVRADTVPCHDGAP